MGAVLIVVGLSLLRGNGNVHDIGLTALGYGLGVAVAAGCLAVYGTRRRRK